MGYILQLKLMDCLKRNSLFVISLFIFGQPTSTYNNYINIITIKTNNLRFVSYYNRNN